MDDWQQLKNLYQQKVKGTAVTQVMASVLMPLMMESVSRLWNELRSDQEERSATLQRRLAETDAKSLAAKKVLEDERNQKGDSIEVAKRQWISERMELERQNEDLKRAVEDSNAQHSRERAQLLDSERTLREQLKMMQQQLQASANAPAKGGKESGATSAELHSLKDAVVAMMSELKG